MIPPEAKKVFDGVIFDVYQWRQDMYDGSVRTFEGVKRADAANMIVATEDGKILYQDQRQPHRAEAFRCLPCGGIEPGEDPLEGAKRELLEETGYAAEDWELLATTRPSDKVQWAIHSYVARGARKVAEQRLDPGERIEVEFLTLDELLDEADSDAFFHTDIRPLLVKAKYHPPTREWLEEKLFKGGGAA